MDYLEFKDTLAHHGVKGQKWGVRKNTEESTEKVQYLKPDKNKEQVKKSLAVGAGATLGAIGAGVLSSILYRNTVSKLGGEMNISEKAMSAFRRNTALRSIGFTAIGATLGYSLYKLKQKYDTPDRAYKDNQNK